MATKKVHNKAKQILSNKEHKSIEQVEQDLQMKLQAAAQRLRKCTNRNEGFHQNKLFQEDAKKFYRQFSKECVTVSDPPSLEKIEEFWRDILENEVIPAVDTNWIKQEEQVFKDVSTEEWEDFTISEIQNIIK